MSGVMEAGGGWQLTVLRLLRGEGLDALAREHRMAAGTISAWREEFLAAGRESLKSRPAPVEDRRLAEALNVFRRLDAPRARVRRVAGVSQLTTQQSVWQRNHAAVTGEVVSTAPFVLSCRCSISSRTVTARTVASISLKRPDQHTCPAIGAV